MDEMKKNAEHEEFNPKNWEEVKDGYQNVSIGEGYDDGVHVGLVYYRILELAEAGKVKCFSLDELKGIEELHDELIDDEQDEDYKNLFKILKTMHERGEDIRPLRPKNMLHYCKYTIEDPELDELIKNNPDKIEKLLEISRLEDLLENSPDDGPMDGPVTIKE